VTGDRWFWAGVGCRRGLNEHPFFCWASIRPKPGVPCGSGCVPGWGGGNRTRPQASFGDEWVQYTEEPIQGGTWWIPSTHPTHVHGLIDLIGIPLWCFYNSIKPTVKIRKEEEKLMMHSSIFRSAQFTLS
jgi:hypothetical protein